MLFASAEELTRSTGTLDNWGAMIAEQQWKPGLGEFLGASTRQAFDRTLGVRAWEAGQIRWNEHQAEQAGTLRRFESEDEYRESEYFREGIEFTPNMSNERARILAENYDSRREWERVIEGGYQNGGWQYNVLGFGAGMVGSLPDPINLIPFGGQAITGARLAGMTGRQILRRAGVQGLIEGAAGNLVSSSVAAWDLNRKGEDITAQDVLLDTAFGAVAGPVFSTGGALLGRATARGRYRADISGIIDFLPEDSTARKGYQDLLRDMRQGDAQAYAAAVEPVGVMREQGFADLLRRNLTDAERLEVTRAMELALLSIDEGRGVDVRPALEGSRTISKAQVEALKRSLADGMAENVSFGTLEPSMKEALNKIRTENGEPLISGEELIIPANVVQKLIDKRILQDGMAPDEVASLLLRIFHDDADGVASTRYPHIQAVIALRGELADLGFISVNPRTGETVIKSIYTEKAKRLDTRLGNQTPSRRDALTPSSRAGEQMSEPGKSRQPGRFTDHRDGVDEGSIRRDGGEVNAEAEGNLLEELGAGSGPDGDGGAVVRPILVDASGRKIDWRPEAREDFPPLPDEGALEAGRSETAEPSPEEIEVRQLRQEGKLGAEQVAELEAVEAEAAKLDELQEAALSVAECIIGAVK